MPHSPVIFVTGASGFVGRHVVRALLAKGYGVRALAREPARFPMQEAGLTAVRGNIREADGLPAAAAGCAAVIHLVGIIAETKQSGTFEQVHTEGTRNVLAAARAAGITRFIHMSALGTRPDAPARYHQSKWAAEELVRGAAEENSSAGMNWTIFQPSLIHGPGGEFTRMLRDWSLGKAAPYVFMPYFGSGLLGQRAGARVQPVFVGDMAHVFVEALRLPATIHQTFAVAGPKAFTWPEMLRTASGVFRGRPKLVLGIPTWWAMLLTALPLPLPFNRDQVLMSQEDGTADVGPLTAAFPGLALRDFAEALAAYKNHVNE